MGQEKYLENENNLNYQNQNDSQILSTNSQRINSLEEPMTKDTLKSAPSGTDDFNKQNNN